MPYNFPLTEDYRSQFILSDTITIADGQTVSSAFKIPVGYEVVGFIFPSTFTTYDITFQGSLDNSTFYEIKDSGDATTASAAYLINDAVASKMHPVDSRVFACSVYGKLVSATAQAGGDTITVIYRRYL